MLVLLCIYQNLPWLLMLYIAVGTIVGTIFGTLIGQVLLGAFFGFVIAVVSLYFLRYLLDGGK